MRNSLFLAALMLLGCATPKKDDYISYVNKANRTQINTQSLQIRLEPGSLDVRGEYDSSDEFNHNNMLYSGDAGLVGMLAQVATHAAISNNAQNARVSSQQQQANKVLEPLSEILNATNTELLQFDAETVQWLKDEDASGFGVLISKPIFFLSQDGKSLSLKHVVSLPATAQVSRSKKNQFVYSNLIEVMAEPIVAEQPIEFWQQDAGSELKSTMQSMYKTSLLLALADIRGELTQNSVAETFKLTHREKLRIERGNKVESECGQLVIRNLRGWLLVAPKAANDEGAGNCVASL